MLDITLQTAHLTMMIIPFDTLLGYAITVILFAITATWIILIKSILESLRHTPKLDSASEDTTIKTHLTNNTETTEKEKKEYLPKVSIIVPARNEQDYINNCLDSLIQQDYPNYEIIVIDDASQDNTGQIIKKYTQKTDKIVGITVKDKPKDWMGKNWACYTGYKRATGDLLLFTDSDTKHSYHILTLVVKYLTAHKLDAVTVIPRLVAQDFWTRVTLPVLCTFLHTRFSALRVNDPTKKTGYFFGSFFIIKKLTYETVGTHKGVKHEIIEDGALGKKVKESGHKMKMVGGEHLLEAIWARDPKTLWSALKRLMIPLYLQSKKIAVGIFMAVAFLLSVPFLVLGYAISAYLYVYSDQLVDTVMMTANAPNPASSLLGLLMISSGVASALVYAGATIEAVKALNIKLRYAILNPIGGMVITIGFLSGLIQAKKDAVVQWRGRQYHIKGHAQDAVHI